MILDPNEQFAKFEKVGVKAVEEKLAQGAYGEKRARLAELWLERKSDSNRTNDDRSSEWRKPAIVIAVGMFIVAVLSLFVDVGSLLKPQHVGVSPSDQPSVTTPAENEDSSQADIANLHAFLVDRYPELNPFKFMVYSYGEDLDGVPEHQGQVSVYSATKTDWNAFSTYPCGYPDQATTLLDEKQGVAFSACGFPSWTLPANEFREIETSHIQFRVHFFDVDRTVITNVDCACGYLYFKDPILNVEARTIQFSIGGDAENVFVSGYPAQNVTFPNVNVQDWQSRPVLRVQVSFDEDWLPISFFAID
ncbi:MAG: hypothetical protein HRT82_11260 [Henriciella sp.]|nr:hypothetical protein [Henriciella sp.]